MSYIATSTGKHIDFVNITPDQICIEDIARGLSNECRFAGQLESFYSVAQHSVYVSRLCRGNTHWKPCCTMLLRRISKISLAAESHAAGLQGCGKTH